MLEEIILAAKQTIQKTKTIKRATRAYPYKQNNNTEQATNNKSKHTRKAMRVKKNASK